MQSNNALQFLGAVGLAVLLAGSACSRELPSDWPSNSPVSPEADAAPVSRVTLALDSDPPLPGEPTDGWIGLDRPDAEDAKQAEEQEHKHEHKHGGHATPDSKADHDEH